jgi:hypothetical protein
VYGTAPNCIDYMHGCGLVYAGRPTLHVYGIHVGTAPGIVAAAPQMLLFYSHVYVACSPVVCGISAWDLWTFLDHLMQHRALLASGCLCLLPAGLAQWIRLHHRVCPALTRLWVGQLLSAVLLLPAMLVGTVHRALLMAGGRVIRSLLSRRPLACSRVVTAPGYVCWQRCCMQSIYCGTRVALGWQLCPVASSRWCVFSCVNAVIGLDVCFAWRAGGSKRDLNV